MRILLNFSCILININSNIIINYIDLCIIIKLNNIIFINVKTMAQSAIEMQTPHPIAISHKAAVSTVDKRAT